jgi:ELWxxDGT repeat protein
MWFQTTDRRRPTPGCVFVRPAALALWVTLAAAGGALAQAPTLVKDINPGTYPTLRPSAWLQTVVGVSGSRVYLDGMSSEGGDPQSWVTDGTVAGTHTLLDLHASSGADLDGTFYFRAETPEGDSLWKTDGTAAGTVFVSRFSTDPGARGMLSKVTKAGSRLFFVGDDGVHGAELWTTDGTAAGTKLVKDATPGPANTFDNGGLEASLVGVGGRVFYSCGGTQGCGIWGSDGTEAGTVQLADLSSVSATVGVNGTAFFAASDPVHGRELWKGDGTVAGTVLVRDILPGPQGSNPTALVSFGGALYFRLYDGSTWKSDGTEGGTVLVHTHPSSDPLVPSGDLLFSAGDGQLRASDGTGPGTSMVRDFGASFSLSTAATIPGALLFWVDRGLDGLELWRSDGTPAGTTLVRVVEPGVAVASPGPSVSIPGAAIHLVDGTSSRLWRSDGTEAGTFPLEQLRLTPRSGYPSSLTDANGTLFLSAVDADHGVELWKSDGTPTGTILLKDIRPGPESSDPRGFVTTSSKVYFTACVEATGCEMYCTDGTEQGTRLVKDIWPGPLSGPASRPALLGELLILAANDGLHGVEPWRSDGTSDGTFLLGDLTPGAASSQVRLLGVLNGAFYLSASDGSSTTLWRTDGTTSGTVAVGSMASVVGAGAEIGGVLVFSASDPDHGTELWNSDGTAAGTSLLLDINPSGDSSPIVAARVGSRLFFWADDGTHGFEPWVTDGTAAGTSLLKDVNPGPASCIWWGGVSVGGFGTSRLGSTLYFIAYDGVHGYELWKTDGTPAGTDLVRDVAQGPPGSMDFEFLVAAGHEVFFTATDHVSGRELWRSDGTEGGTTLVADLRAGLEYGLTTAHSDSSRPILARSGGKVFFRASDGTTGDELWSLPIPLGFRSVTPCRVADTRDPAGTAGGVPLANAQTLILPVAGRCGIPSTAVSVAANVTVVNPTATGSLSVFAGGPIVSGTTEVPVTAGKTRALNAIPILGTVGSLSVRAGLPEGGTTHVVLDVSGYFE